MVKNKPANTGGVPLDSVLAAPQQRPVGSGEGRTHPKKGGAWCSGRGPSVSEASHTQGGSVQRVGLAVKVLDSACGSDAGVSVFPGRACLYSCVRVHTHQEDDAVKVLHSVSWQIWKSQQWPQDWKRSVFIPIAKKGTAKECSDYQFSSVQSLSCFCLFVTL